MIKWNDFRIADYAERLVFKKGKFLLTVEGDKVTSKILTTGKAREWYRKRFPACDWKKVKQEIKVFKMQGA